MVAGETVSSFPFPLHSLYLFTPADSRLLWGTYIGIKSGIFPFCQLCFQADQFPDCKAAN